MKNRIIFLMLMLTLGSTTVLSQAAPMIADNSAFLMICGTRVVGMPGSLRKYRVPVDPKCEEQIVVLGQAYRIANDLTMRGQEIRNFLNRIRDRYSLEAIPVIQSGRFSVKGNILQDGSFSIIEMRTGAN